MSLPLCMAMQRRLGDQCGAQGLQMFVPSQTDQHLQNQSENFTICKSCVG